MTFLEFSRVFGNDVPIDMRNVMTYFSGLDRRRLYEWQKRGLIIKVANNYYIMADKPPDSDGLKSIACKIYEPSYIGLASALSWYGFIPEAVFQTTAVTTRRNRLIKTAAGDFSYRSIRPGLFFGSSLIEHGNTRFFISDPEKTLLDCFYYTPDSDRKETIDGMRLNIEEIRRKVDPRKLQAYLQLFGSPAITQAVRILTEMINAQP